MEWITEKTYETAGTKLTVCAGKIGADILITIEGGDRPHIGCVVQAVPRPSLSGSGEGSATASVLNLTGHKDEFLCRKLAEMLCSRLGMTVVCTGGVHIEKITAEQIRELENTIDILGQELLRELKRIVDR